MTFYLGIIPDKGLHCNPLRHDTKPTASFYRAANGELVFKDFMTGFHGNFMDVVCEKFKCEYTKALRIVANDFGIVKSVEQKNEAQIVYDGSKIEEKGETVIQCEIKDFTDSEMKWWNSFGITSPTLKKYHVFSVKNLFLNGNHLLTTTPRNPAYGYYFGREQGRELWKIYFPLKTQFRFMLNNSKLQGAKQLPDEGDIVVVTKSMKDVMVLHELGIAAVAPQAESVIITSRQYQALKKRFKYVICNGDWDAAGQHFMAKSRKAFGCICMSFVNKHTDGKDISDFVKLHGIEAARKLITDLKAKLLKYSTFAS
jgi:hypothetical protein